MNTREVLEFICNGLAIWNAFELFATVFMTFTRYGGVYFWSLLVTAFGIVLHSLGYFRLYAVLHGHGNLFYIVFVLVSVGWWTMVTGQAFVLWSRLHLVVYGFRGRKILFWTKTMILMDVILLHVPTTVLTFSSTTQSKSTIRGYGIMEKIELIGFFVQETTLSSIYIWEATKLLRKSLQKDDRQSDSQKVLKQLILINAIIIAMDAGLVALELASLYTLQTMLKSLVYSIKLKFEFVILARLMGIVGGNITTRPPEDPPKPLDAIVTIKPECDSKQRHDHATTTKTVASEVVEVPPRAMGPRMDCIAPSGGLA
ncbi:Integral membrane protein [Teratosphaeria destructans]|uniref:Integral membrane protein n=1 Tax=Teratosphaeria destructans TaxID=418781 RepID=A0A9W7T0F0_9PEZI|nr:Integral membrane protein [Teratosphaeria destructans]